MDKYAALRRPLVTEKGSLLQERNKYVFEVAPTANKTQVREAVERAFNVKVLSVNILWSRGEERRLGTRRFRVADMKKAIVTLREGDKIPIFEGA